MRRRPDGTWDAVLAALRAAADATGEIDWTVVIAAIVIHVH